MNEQQICLLQQVGRGLDHCPLSRQVLVISWPITGFVSWMHLWTTHHQRNQIYEFIERNETESYEKTLKTAPVVMIATSCDTVLKERNAEHWKLERKLVVKVYWSYFHPSMSPSSGISSFSYHPWMHHSVDLYHFTSDDMWSTKGVSGKIKL